MLQVRARDDVVALHELVSLLLPYFEGGGGVLVVTEDATFTQENGLAEKGVAGGLLRGCVVSQLPLVVIAPIVSDDDELHVGVGEAAELGTAAFVDAGFAGHEPGLVNYRGHNVQLTGEVGNPEAVDDIIGEEVDIDSSVDGNVKLVGRFDFIVGVAELPPPLVGPSRDVHPWHGNFVSDGCGRNHKSGLFDGYLIG